MSRKLISSGTVRERKYGSSQAVRVGDFVAVAGTTALNARGRVVGRADAARQARFIYEKIERTLAKAGATLADVIRVRTYVVDITNWEAVAAVQGEVFARARPAATLVEVSALVNDDLLVEIEVDAIVPPGSLARTGTAPRRTPGGPTGAAARHALRVRVGDEFGKLRTAILHDGSNATDVTMDDLRWSLPPSELARNPHVGPSSKARLRKQHAGLRRCLAARGVRLISPLPQPGAHGQVFTRDPCFVIGDRLFVGGLTDDWRHAETIGLVDILSRCASVTDLSGDGATIEGGDVIVLDSARRVLVGLSRHTNVLGVRKLAAALEGTGIDVVSVPHEALHLDCCLTPLPNGEALFASAWLPKASVKPLGKYFTRLIPLPRDEATRHLAANIVWLDRRTAVSSTAAKKTAGLLRAKGYDVITLGFSDLVRQWGSVRCAICPIERA